MSSLPYLNLAGYFAKYGVLLTVFTNSLLIHLTWYHVKNITPAYKCLILLMAVLGIVFSMVEIIVHPFMHSYNSSCMYFSVTLSSLNHSVGIALLTLYSLMYTLIICCLAIQFIYRSFVVLSPRSLKWFHGRRISIWVCYGVICSASWLAAIYQTLPDEYSQHYLTQEFAVNYDTDLYFVPSYHLVAFDEKGSVRMKNLIGVFGLASVLSSQYIVMIYCGIQIHSGMDHSATMRSGKLHRLQKQLFNTLLLQLVVPSIFYNTPVLLMYIAPYLNLKLSFPSGVMICFFSLYPATDSLILMSMVTEYYMVLQKLLVKLIEYLKNWASNVAAGSSAEDTSSGEENY